MLLSSRFSLATHLEAVEVRRGPNPRVKENGCHFYHVWFVIAGIICSTIALLPGCAAPPPMEPPEPRGVADEGRPPLEGQVHYWRIETDERSLERLNDDVDADIEVPAVLLTENDFHRIEVEIQGASSRRLPKLSYKLKFDQPFIEAIFGGEGGEPFSRLILKAMYVDQSLSREAIAFELARLAGQVAPRTDFVWLDINGESEGLYVLVEQVNGDFLARHGFDVEGYLYKAVRKHGADGDFHPSRDLELAFEEKHPVMHEDGYQALMAFADRLQTFSPEDPDSLSDVLSVDAYFDRLCWASFTQNVDATRQNFFLYSPDGVGDWMWIPWDSDVALSNHWRPQQPVLPPSDYPLTDGGNYFSRRLLAHEATRVHYASLCSAQLDGVWTSDVVMALVRDYEERLTDAINADLALRDRPSSAAEEFEEMRSFFRERPQVITEALEALVEET